MQGSERGAGSKLLANDAREVRRAEREKNAHEAFINIIISTISGAFAVLRKERI